MRLTSFYQAKTIRFLFSAAAILIFAALIAKAQSPRQLSLADILIGLKSSKATMPEKNKILSDAVAERGITFALTTQIEDELMKTGADKILVDAIRQKSPVVKTEPTPEIKRAEPKSTPAVSLPDFTFYQKRADENIGKGEYDLAIVDYNKALELNPKSVPAYFNRARAFYFKREFADAVDSYTKVLELTPEDSVVYYNRGVAYEKLGDSLKAMEDYKKAVELDANNEPAKENLQKLKDAETAKAKTQTPQQTEPKPAETPTTALTTPANDTPTIFNYGRIDASQAERMVTPAYPPVARNMNAEGQVVVEVEIDEDGNITSAKAVSGHPLLRNPAEDAARRSKLKPAMINGKAVKATGQIIYSFKK